MRLHLPLHVSLILLQSSALLASPSALSWLQWHRPSCFQGVGSGSMDAHSRLETQAPVGSAGGAGDQMLAFASRNMSHCGKECRICKPQVVCNMQSSPACCRAANWTHLDGSIESLMHQISRKKACTSECAGIRPILGIKSFAPHFHCPRCVSHSAHHSDLAPVIHLTDLVEYRSEHERSDRGDQRRRRRIGPPR